MAGCRAVQFCVESSSQSVAVKIKRERPDQRRHHRVTAPIFVSVAGTRVRAADWSLGGLRIEDFTGTLPELTEHVKLALSLPFQGFEVAFSVTGEVVRRDDDRRLFAVKFIDLGEREAELMQHFIEELVRGSMSEVADTINRIDVPVTPASLQPDPNPSKTVPIKRWPIRALAMTAVYAVIGFVIIGYAGLLVYSNYFRLEIQTAVISAPVESVEALTDGRAVWGKFKPGDHVRAGDIVVALVDHQLEREIEMAEITVKERQAQLAYLIRRQKEEIERVESFATIELKGVQQAKLEVDGLEADLKAAAATYARLAALHDKGHTPAAKLEEAERKLVTIRKLLEARKVELKARLELLERNIGKRHYTGDNMVGDLPQIEAQVKLAEEQIKLATERRATMVRHRERLAVRAPFDGTILELPRASTANVKKGAVLAVLEQRTKRQVTAYLTQDEVLRVGLGDEVPVFIPALSETVKGRVVRIDRTTGFVRQQDRQQAAGYNWRGNLDRSAKVIIAFLDQEKIRDPERYRAGLPVIVIFPQRSTSQALHAVKQRITTFATGEAPQPTPSKPTPLQPEPAPAPAAPKPVDPTAVPGKPRTAPATKARRQQDAGLQQRDVPSDPLQAASHRLRQLVPQRTAAEIAADMRERLARLVPSRSWREISADARERLSRIAPLRTADEMHKELKERLRALTDRMFGAPAEPNKRGRVSGLGRGRLSHVDAGLALASLAAPQAAAVPAGHPSRPSVRLLMEHLARRSLDRAWLIGVRLRAALAGWARRQPELRRMPDKPELEPAHKPRDGRIAALGPATRAGAH
ncbi:MAG: PilZ domain-containing protein [Hyphomicrobiaceae bacterium]